MKRQLNDDRFFGGKKWRYVSAHMHKADAEKAATRARSGSVNARVLKGPSKKFPRAHYVVYKSNKK